MADVFDFPQRPPQPEPEAILDTSGDTFGGITSLPEKASADEIEVLFSHTQTLITRVMADVRFSRWRVGVDRSARIVEVKDARLGGEARSLTVTPADEKWGYHVKKVAHRPQEIEGRGDYIRHTVEFSLYPYGRATKVKRTAQEGDGPHQLDSEESERTMSKRDVKEVDSMLQEIIGLGKPKRWYQRIGHAAVSDWFRRRHLS